VNFFILLKKITWVDNTNVDPRHGGKNIFLRINRIQKNEDAYKNADKMRPLILLLSHQKKIKFQQNSANLP